MMRSAVVRKVRKQGGSKARLTKGLDSSVLEAIERFVRVLARPGNDPDELAQAFAAACRRIPDSWAALGSRTQREIREASHVLSVWYSDPNYLDASGIPLKLAARGPAPSIEALVRSVDPKLKLVEVIKYLLKTRVIRRSGGRYIPVTQILSLRGAGGPGHFRDLRSLLGMLRTLENNRRPKEEAQSWFEFFAENPNFPLRARAAFDSRLSTTAFQFLHAIDADMLRCERGRRPGEPTTRIGVGVYRFEDEPDAELRAPRESRTSSRRR
jgi:hypothetical protein